MGMSNEQKKQLAAKFMMQGLEEMQAERAAEMTATFYAVKTLVMPQGRPLDDAAAVWFAMAVVR